jgi:hypothetical protein
MLGEEDSLPNPADTDPPCQSFHVLNPADTDPPCQCFHVNTTNRP